MQTILTTKKQKRGAVNTIKHENIGKVKVQYIQQGQHSLVRKTENAHFDLKQMKHAAADEIENVEYLDESSILDEEYMTPTTFAHDNTKPLNFDDTFYPNAIYCLVATYREKYELMKGKRTAELERMRIWEQIAEEMNESYFNFNAEQIRQKYAHLRNQYFEVKSTHDIAAFEYFPQLHEIYQDKTIEKIVNNDKTANALTTSRTTKVYVDEVIMAKNYETESFGQEAELVKMQHAEIASKESEFIDILEKELLPNKVNNDAQFLERTTVKNIEIPASDDIRKRSLQSSQTYTRNELPNSVANTKPTETESSKRLKLGTPLVSIQHAEEQQERVNVADASVVPKELSLAAYNQARDRRHQELMAIMQQGLQLQQRSIEMQRLLLEQIIKRL